MSIRPTAHRVADSLRAFDSEAEPGWAPSPGARVDRPLVVAWLPPAEDPPLSARRLVLLARITFAAAAVLALYALAHRASSLSERSRPTLAAVTIHSDPAGALVSMSGELRGVTPLTLALAPGSYAFEVLALDGRRQDIVVSARADLASAHYVQFPHQSPGAGSGIDPQ